MEITVEALHQVAEMLTSGFDAAALHGASDAELLSLVGGIEELGRIVDAYRTFEAGEVADRSNRFYGSGGLSARMGCGSPAELLARATRQSQRSMRSRMRLAEVSRPRYNLIHEPLAARFPRVGEQLMAGRLSVDAATAIVRSLTGAFATDEDIRDAEAYLVSNACGLSYRGDPAGVPWTVEETALQATIVSNIIDPDGVLGSEERAMRRRGLSAGHNAGGLVNYKLALMPETAATLEAILNSLQSPRTRTVFMSDEDRTQAEADDGCDPRSAAQKRHDILGSILDTASRDKDLPRIGGIPPAIMVSVRDEDLTAGIGAAFVGGIDIPISIHAAAQRACTAGIQKVIIGKDGRIIQLESPDRGFTAQQRKAIALRDGGCVIPGCTIPMMWVEIHHVYPHAAGGPTHTDNGVALCWFHHRTIDTSGWQIQMRRGVPFVKMPPWFNGNHNPTTWRRATKSPTALLTQLGAQPGQGARTQFGAHIRD